ncbi:hypothetical protein BUZ56_01870 [Staphylococcus hyicus]|nr:hypothetical protein BUZ58_10085 [Staphylococcus hyicus]PTJ89478.1 hypothetical protein BUZ56_01870 [Staphylococcus hyicus]
MNKLMIQYDNQLKCLNLQSRKTYIINGQEDGSISFKGLRSDITITQTQSGTWYVDDYPLQSQTSINGVDITWFTENNFHAFI